MARDILVIGGTKFFGKDIVELALGAGDKVTVVSRGNERPDFWDRIEHIACDRNDVEELAAKLRRRTFEVVVDNIAFGADDVSSTLAILKGNIGHYILTSTVAVCIGARPFRMPLTEDDAIFELEDEPAFAGFVQPTPEWMINYASGKIAAEQVVIGQADVPYTIIRPPNVTGPNDPTGRCQFYIQRIMDGQPVILTNGGVQSIQPVYRRDLAMGYIQAMEKEGAKNQVYHLSQDKSYRLVDWLMLIAEQLGKSPNFVGIAADTLTRAGFEYAEHWTYIGTLTLDISRAQTDLGFSPTPLSEWTEATVKWCVRIRTTLMYQGTRTERKRLIFRDDSGNSSPLSLVHSHSSISSPRIGIREAEPHVDTIPQSIYTPIRKPEPHGRTVPATTAEASSSGIAMSIAQFPTSCIPQPCLLHQPAVRQRAMQLSGPQFAQLQEALLDAYTAGGLRQMLRVQLDVDLEQVAGGSNLTEVTFSLIRWAERREQVQPLIQAAHKGNQENGALASLLAASDAWFTQQSESPQPLGDVAPTTPQSKHQVFLSYSRLDSRQMHIVYDALTGAGLTVWTDEGLAVGTHSWENAIEQAIEDAQCMVVLLSPNAKRSKWVRTEVEYALDIGLEVLPVLLEGNKRQSIPLLLYSFQYEDGRKELATACDRLLATLRRFDLLPAQPSQAAPSPQPSRRTLAEIQRQALTQQQELLGRQLEAAYTQLSSTLDAAQRVTIQQKIDGLVKEMAQVEAQLDQLEGNKPPEQAQAKPEPAKQPAAKRPAEVRQQKTTPAVSTPIDFEWITIPEGEFLMGERRIERAHSLPARIPHRPLSGDQRPVQAVRRCQGLRCAESLEEWPHSRWQGRSSGRQRLLA